MNRRRMMMLQQNSGYELVYDASSGLLPTDVGYTYNNIGSAEIVDDALVMTSAGQSRCRYDLLTATGLRKSFEVWITPDKGCTSIRLNNNTTRVSFFITTTTTASYYITWGVGVYTQWEKPFVKIPYTKGDMLKLRLFADNGYTAAYMNDNLIYETYTEYPQNANVVNIDVTEGNSKIHKMIYKEW